MLEVNQLQSINDLSQAHDLANCTHGVFKNHPESPEVFILHDAKRCLSPLGRDRKSLGSQIPVVERSLRHQPVAKPTGLKIH